MLRKKTKKKMHRFQSALDECFTVSENSTFTSFVYTTIVPGQPVGFSKEVCPYMTDADRLKLICQSDGIASGRVTCPGNNPVLVKIRVHSSLTLRENKSPLFVDTSETHANIKTITATSITNPVEDKGASARQTWAIQNTNNNKIVLMVIT